MHQTFLLVAHCQKWLFSLVWGELIIGAVCNFGDACLPYKFLKVSPTNLRLLSMSKHQSRVTIYVLNKKEFPRILRPSIFTNTKYLSPLLLVFSPQVSGKIKSINIKQRSKKYD